MTTGFAAKQWLHNLPPAKCILLEQPSVEARQSGPGRGYGLFATRHIPAYTEFLNEEPLILMSPSDNLPQLWTQFQSLSLDSQDIYLALAHPAVSEETDGQLIARLRARSGDKDNENDVEIHRMITVGKIMQTNAFNVDVADGQGKRHRALFPTIARVNHSCLPNAHVCFQAPSSSSSSSSSTTPVGSNTSQNSSPRGRMTVRAVSDIARGAEITVAYYSILLERDERQQRAAKWGFRCACAGCAPGSSADSEKERLRFTLSEWMESSRRMSISDARKSPSKEDVEAACRVGESLVSKVFSSSPGLVPALPDAMERVGKLLHANEREEEEVADWLSRAVLLEAKLTGVESSATTDRLEALSKYSNRYWKPVSDRPRIVANSKNVDTWRIAWGDAQNTSN